MNESRGRLHGRVGVVTGGASGIGAECARRFVREGARVVLGDRNAELLAAMAEELGDACVTEIVDVTNEPDVQRMVTRAVAEWGHLDLALNAAGLGGYAPVAKHLLDQWQTVIDVCLTGVFLSTKHEAAAMLASGGSSEHVIINIASINAKVPASGMSAYCSAKAGVTMFTKCAAVELAPSGVRVVAIGPGYVETPLTAFAQAMPAIQQGYVDSIPLGRAGRPGDIADAAVFLASSEASWITGETFYVDGAESTQGYPDLAKLAGMA